MFETKKCKCCGKDLSVTNFYHDRKRKDGLRSYCKSCCVAISKRNFIAHQPREELAKVEHERKLFNRLGGLKISILNYAKKGESHFNISSTEGHNYKTNDKVNFMKKLSEMIGV